MLIALFARDMIAHKIPMNYLISPKVQQAHKNFKNIVNKLASISLDRRKSQILISDFYSFMHSV